MHEISDNKKLKQNKIKIYHRIALSHLSTQTGKCTHYSQTNAMAMFRRFAQSWKVGATGRYAIT